MCNRYVETGELNQVRLSWPGVSWSRVSLEKRYNISPRDPVVGITSDRPLEAEWLAWGLLPFWAKDWKLGARCLNAKAETVATLPSFREAWKRGHRCALIATGYVESITGADRKKHPQLVEVDGGKPFAMAGVWEDWPGEPDQTPSGRRIRALFEGRIRTCTILTTAPNEVARQVHDRMPVLLAADDTERWLGCSPDEAATMLTSFDAMRMGYRPVNHIINKSGVDVPECLDPPAPD